MIARVPIRIFIKGGKAPQMQTEVSQLHLRGLSLILLEIICFLRIFGDTGNADIDMGNPVPGGKIDDPCDR